MSVRADHLLVLDLETTGLDFDDAWILEVAAVVIDVDLEQVVDELSAVVHPDMIAGAFGADLADLIESQTVVDMHTRSGLLVDVVTIGHPESEVRADLAALVGRWPDALLCGSGVTRFDRPLLAQQWPETVRPLTKYWELDLRSVREFVGLYCPDVAPYQPAKAHRAMADVQDTIGELRHYRDTLGVDDVEVSS